MKPLFINRRSVLLFLFSFFVFSFAATADPGAEEVSAKVLSRFANSYGTAESVTWKVTKQFSKASFMLNNKLTEVFYNRRNKLIATSVHITLQELPAGGADNIRHDYAKYGATSAIQYTDVRGDTSYFVQLENDRNKIIVQVDEEGHADCVKMERKQASKQDDI